MNDLCDVIEKVAASPSNVLVLGESGTGKELVARAIHERSPRADGPFVTLNVSTIPDTLVESYLFGHERGAFTGAERQRDGLFRAASGGTLFLDEIGELPMPVQAKLLRAVEMKEVLPVGSDRGLKVDARIIAATHRDLGKLVEEGRFRHDLMYRLQVVQLKLPPLRERLGDVPKLALHFVALHARQQRKSVRAIAITPIDLPSELGIPESLPEASTPAMALPCIARDEDCNLERAVLQFQRAHIASVLDRVHGSRESAAKLLGLSPATLYRYLQRVGLKGYRSEERS